MLAINIVGKSIRKPISPLMPTGRIQNILKIFNFHQWIDLLFDCKRYTALKPFNLL